MIVGRVLAQESLTVYIAHLAIVYGSAWNLGLHQRVGPTLSWLPAIGLAGLMWIAMALLAAGWHGWKRLTPRGAALLRLCAMTFLFSRLL
jgi:hypothetical protein